MTRPRTPLLCLLLLCFATALPAQEGSAGKPDLKQLRKEADAAVQASDFATATAAFRKICESNPKDGDAWHMLGYSLHASGKLDEALPIHKKAAEFPSSAPASTYNIACVHALQGRTDDAFVSLEKAIELGFGDDDLLATDKDLESLRKDERFTKLVQNLKAKAPTMQAFAQTTERKSSRVAWFDRSGSPGQIALDYCPVPWNDSYEQAIAAGTLKGKKWRLGADFWTTLDTSIDLQFGATTVQAGYYYLTLEQRDTNAFVLALHAADAVRKLKLDPVFAGKLGAGIEVPLTHAESSEKAGALAITIAPDRGSHTQGSLQLHYGTHALSVPVSMRVE